MNRQTVIAALIAAIISIPAGFGAGWFAGQADAKEAADDKIQALELERIELNKATAAKGYQGCLDTAEMIFYQIDRNYNFQPYTVQPGEGFNKFRTVVEILCSRDATEESPLTK